MEERLEGEDELLEGLTQAQRQAVSHVEGPLLVLAGPGSGKTRVITRRMAYLILRAGIPPWNVLAITFTNKAAGEMRQRMGQLVSARQAQAATLTTFHSFCARVLRQYAERMGLPGNYSIYDMSDQERAVKQALEVLQISTNNFPPGRVMSAISSAKNELLDPAAYEATARDYFSKNVAKIYQRYQMIMKRNHALDFDDLLLGCVELMKKHPDVLDELRQRYRYVLIDEYQDTNHAQFVLAHALVPGGKAGGGNLCATGDPDQSIYGWRGASLRNILEFEEYYPDATVVRLEQNYRSTKHIVSLADGLIKNNIHRKHKTLWTENEEGTKAECVMCQDEMAEARWVTEYLMQLYREHGLEWRDMAVFYRTNSLSRVMEDAMRRQAIPYQIARGTAFFDRKEVKDAIGYLRVTANPADEVNLLRIINTPARGISETSVKAMQAKAVASGQSMYEVMQRPEDVAGLNNRAVTAVGKFAAMVRKWRWMAGLEGEEGVGSGRVVKGEEEAEVGLRELVEKILEESGLDAFYRKETTAGDEDRLANLGELVSSAQQFDEEYTAQQQALPEGRLKLEDKLGGYLERISLVSDVDGVDAAQGAVTLMTLHAAKGLEFAGVVMIGLEEGLLPHQRSVESKRDVEEERRLCFVGITRARRFLAMTHTVFRTVFGRTTPAVPSRFLDEMAKEHLKKTRLVGSSVGWGLGAVKEEKKEDEGQEVTEDSTLREQDGEQETKETQTRRLVYEEAEEGEGKIAVGMVVKHPSFGRGKVLRLSGAGMQMRAMIVFESVGVKTLLVAMARLQRVYE